MSYHVYFAFSTGLTKSLHAPKGTFKRIMDHVKDVEEELGLTRQLHYKPEGEKRPPGFLWRNPPDDMVKKLGPRPPREGDQWWLKDRDWEANRDRMGNLVFNHNDFVRWLYEDFEKWFKKPVRGKAGETITPKMAHQFWGALRMIEWPRDLWSKDHFTRHMEHMYALLINRKDEDMELDCEKFTPKQIDALIWLLEGEIDIWDYDLRFAPSLDANLNQTGYLKKCYDGGYNWCSKCGAIDSDCFFARVAKCPHVKKGECDLKNEYPSEFED